MLLSRDLLHLGAYPRLPDSARVRIRTVMVPETSTTSEVHTGSKLGLCMHEETSQLWL